MQQNSVFCWLCITLLQKCSAFGMFFCVWKTFWDLANFILSVVTKSLKLCYIIYKGFRILGLSTYDVSNVWKKYFKSTHFSKMNNKDTMGVGFSFNKRPLHNRKKHSRTPDTLGSLRYYVTIKVINVRSDTFGNPIFLKGLQN